MGYPVISRRCSARVGEARVAACDPTVSGARHRARGAGAARWGSVCVGGTSGRVRRNPLRLTLALPGARVLLSGILGPAAMSRQWGLVALTVSFVPRPRNRGERRAASGEHSGCWAAFHTADDAGPRPKLPGLPAFAQGGRVRWHAIGALAGDHRRHELTWRMRCHGHTRRSTWPMSRTRRRRGVLEIDGRRASLAWISRPSKPA
jgi:hypothetical protein